MNEDLQKVWQAAALGLPTAFTVTELEAQSRVRPSAVALQKTDSAPFLHAELIVRRRGHVLRMLWLLLLVPYLGLFAFGRAAAFTWVPLGIALLFAARQSLVLLAASARLTRLRVEMSTGAVGRASPPPRSMQGAWIGLAISVSTVVIGASYWAWGQWRGAETRQAYQLKRDLTECRNDSSTNAALTITACEGVLEHRPGDPEVTAALVRLRARQACEEKLRVANVMIEKGHAEQGLGELTSIGADCPEPLVQAASIKARPLVKNVLSTSRTECLSAVSGEKWEDARARCGVYARYACQGMTVEELVPPNGKTYVSAGPLGDVGWRPADPAYGGLLRARDQLDPGGERWTCPQTAVLRVLSPVSESRGTVAVDASDFLKERPHDLEWAHYLKRVQADPRDADAWLGLGYANKESGRKKDAIVCFKKYLELNPEASTRKELADEIYFLEGK